MKNSSELSLNNPGSQPDKKEVGSSVSTPEEKAEVFRFFADKFKSDPGYFEGDSWSRRVDAALEELQLEPKKYAFLLGGKRHPLADIFTEIYDSVQLVESTERVDTDWKSNNAIIMGALASNRQYILDKIGISVETARKRFEKKTLYCIDCVAQSPRSIRR